MGKNFFLSLVLPILLAGPSIGSRMSQSQKTRVYRQNHYNYRPQSTVLDDEIEYRSYDNKFGPLPESPSGRYGYQPQNNRQYSGPPPYQNPSWGPQPPGEDDYPQDLDLPDEDDVEADAYPPPPPAPRTNYNYRPLGPRPSPPPSPRRYWDDQSGRERGDPSYSFGYDLHDQSRHENSDVFGNVNGDFSFVDDEGTFRKISYSAGAQKGFEVLHKTPNEPSSFAPSPPKRNPIRKPPPPPLIHSEAPRLPPIRIPNPGPPNHRPPPRSPPVDLPDGAGIGISVPVPNGSGGSGGGGGSRDRVKHGGNRHHNSHGSHNNNRDSEREPQLGNGPEVIAVPTGGPPNNNAVETVETGGDEGPKSWGALGGHHNPGRPRQMRKRKPSLVVKVKRPASTAQNQTPAWMYYRTPNPGRPQPGIGAGWAGKKPPTPTPAPYPEDPEDPDQQWNDENDVENQYPKDKSYSFGYNTGDQTRQEVSDAYGNIRGSYSYVDPQGIHRTVHYTAGNSGFKVLNAQPSFLRPVYTEAPSIPIPIPVMSQLSSYQLPQASTIVYHIHPDGISGASEWKPWEPTRTVSKPSIYQRHTRHRRPRMRNSSSPSYAQSNLFRLTHENHRFFPTFSNILEPEPLTADDDSESFSNGYLEENPLFLKQIQQQHRRSHKLRKLTREYQAQPVFQYARSRTSYTQAPRYSVNRLGFNSESAADETALEDQLYSDYETTPKPPRRHHHHRSSKERLRKLEEASKNSTAVKEESTSAPPAEATVATPMMVEGDTEIRGYQGGYGDKNPLLVISESSSSSSSASNSNKARPSRKASGEKRASVETTTIPDSLAAESIVMATILKPEAKKMESKQEKKHLSPAELLRAKMASPPTPKVASISAISLPLSMSSDAAIPFDMNVAMVASSVEADD